MAKTKTAAMRDVDGLAGVDSFDVAFKGTNFEPKATGFIDEDAGGAAMDLPDWITGTNKEITGEASAFGQALGEMSENFFDDIFEDSECELDNTDQPTTPPPPPDALWGDEVIENDDALVGPPSVRPTSISSPFDGPDAPVFNPMKVIHQGMVHKTGDSVFGKAWKPRRFVQTADMCLRYYHGEKLKGEIDLSSASAVYSTCAEGQYWTIVTSNREWSLWCETRSQSQEWISSIQRVIDHLHSGIAGPKTSRRVISTVPHKMKPVSVDDEDLLEKIALQTMQHAESKSDFKVGQHVRCRDMGKEWLHGEVTQLCPLEVKTRGWMFGARWDEVENKTAVGPDTSQIGCSSNNDPRESRQARHSHQANDTSKDDFRSQLARMIKRSTVDKVIAEVDANVQRHA